MNSNEREDEPGSIHEAIDFGAQGDALDRHRTAPNLKREESGPPDPIDRILGSPPIVSERGDLADPRLPDQNDWSSRPFSPSEAYVQPETELGLVATLMQSPRNFPAVVGVWLSLLGFFSGLWGVILAVLGLGFSTAGIWTAGHGGRRLSIALAGIFIAAIYLVAHAVMRI